MFEIFDNKLLMPDKNWMKTSRVKESKDLDIALNKDEQYELFQVISNEMDSISGCFGPDYKFTVEDLMILFKDFDIFQKKEKKKPKSYWWGSRQGHGEDM